MLDIRKSSEMKGWYWCNLNHLSAYGGHFVFDLKDIRYTLWFWWYQVIKHNWRRIVRLGLKFHLRNKY